MNVINEQEELFLPALMMCTLCAIFYWVKGMHLETLNNRQKEAVLQTEGPVLVLAGAGSGKTKVLTTRLAYILEQQLCNAYEIMAITFTNKAANEMRERVGKLLHENVDYMWIGTFHSLCTRILRRDIMHLGYTGDFTIYDTGDQKSLVKEILSENAISTDHFDFRGFFSVCSSIKNLREDRAFIEKHYIKNGKLYGFVFEEYQKKLKRYNALDFDDLILKTIELFEQNPQICEKYQNRFRYIFVDEYQDTNTAQYQFIKMLSKKHKNLCAVGDTDQSIYGWRGADITNILNFEKDFPSAKVILLEQNYRSTKKILQLANRVIKNNAERKDKNLWTENAEGEDITYKNLPTDYLEAEQVCEWIYQMKYKGYQTSEMAILYRTNAQSRVIEEALMRERIAYHVVGGLKFYDRKEVKDILAYLKLIVNAKDNISLERIINEPKRGIGKTTISKLQDFALQFQMSEWEYLYELQAQNFSGSTRQKLLDFIGLISDLKSRCEKMPLTEFVKYTLEHTGYLRMLQDSKRREDQTRIENLSELVNTIEDFEKRNEDCSLNDYLASVSLMSDVDKTQSDEGISLMTIHAAKGLEYKVVFLTGMEERIFPSARSVEEGNMEEERRLCYVAVTRAEDKLFMSSAKSRRVFGETSQQIPSQFLKEMEGAFVEDRVKKNFRESFDRTNLNIHKSEVSDMFKKKESHIKNDGNFRVGDKVKHKKFGVGVIVEIKNKPNGDEVTISFEEKGLKKLNLQLAPITRL